jgi:hypothetical protein
MRTIAATELSLPLKVDPPRASTQVTSPEVQNYLKIIINQELVDIIDETTNQRAQHSAFSQLVFNRVVQHCCSLLKIQYTSKSNQALKFGTPHGGITVSMNDIILFFGKLKVSTFGNHRGTHFLAIQAVLLLSTHGDMLEVKDAAFLKNLKALLTCELKVSALRALERTGLGKIDHLRRRLSEIINKYNK